MLDANTQAQLTTYMQRATQAIEIVASLDDSPASVQMQAFLKDVASSPR